MLKERAGDVRDEPPVIEGWQENIPANKTVTV